MHVTTSNPGVIRFTGGETFEFDIVRTDAMHEVVGARWGLGYDPANFDDDSIRLLGFGGPVIKQNAMGMVIANGGSGEFFDLGYDRAAQAFLFGRIDYDVVSGGFTSLIASSGSAGFVNKSQSVFPSFGDAINEGFQPICAPQVIQGDVNNDKEVNLLDVEYFVAMLINLGGCLEEADMNKDGSVDLLDVAGFVAALTISFVCCANAIYCGSYRLRFF